MGSAPELRVDRSLTKALKRFDADRLRWLDEAAALGPLVALKMGPVKVWVLTDAEAARAVLVTDGSSWTRPPATLVPIRVGVGENLFTQSDRAWAKTQPFVAPAFRRKALEPRLASIPALIDDDIGSIPLDTDVDLERVMARIALRLAAWVLLGEELEADRADELARHQRAVVGWVGTRLGQLTGFLPFAPGAAGREMRRHRAALYAYADEVVARAGARSGGDDDVLGALLQARPAGRALTPSQLRSHVLGLFLAGNETTATALAWAVVHGASNPGEWAKVRADPASNTLPFITESLRLNPAVWGIPRTPTKAGVTLTAGDTTTRVRRGQLVNVYVRGINRDAGLWDEPLRFDPARHDPNAREPGARNPEAPGARESRRALLPFGLGSRGCIGQHLALAELIAVLPALARRGDVAIQGEAAEDAGFALRVRGGLTGRFVAPLTSGRTAR
jgi:cytochrome P450